MVCQLSTRGFIWLPAVLFLAGTANGLFGQMLYVGNFGSGRISAYVIDQESGLLTEVLPRVPSNGLPTSVTVHPSGKFVYVTNGGVAATGSPPNLSAFSINPGTGALTLLSSSPLAGGSSPQAVAIDPSGKFAFVAHQAANNVSAFSLDTATGALSPVAGSPFAAPPGPSSVVAHPNGKFAYVSAAGAGQIAAFNIGADGALTPASGSPFAARNNIFWMAMDAAGKFLFAVERQDNAVLVYSVDATTGALTQVGAPFPAQGGVSGVAVDPGGRFLYVSNAGAGSVTSYNIGATGALTNPRGAIPAVAGAYAAILDPSGKFLYVPGQQANAVVGFAIDQGTGALTPLPQRFVEAGVQPQRGATVLLSPPVIPPISTDAAFNTFSVALPGMPNAGIAQGSRLSISGRNIGPAAAVSSPSSPNDYPLKSELGGASIQIQSGNVTTAAIMLFASNNLVRGIVPSTTPLGDATVTVTYRGRTTAPLPITIVTTSVGIGTLNGAGSGPAAQAVNNPDPANLGGSANQIFNALNLPVKPGQTMALRTTGLGPVTFDETQNLSQELDVPAEVIVGNKLVTAATKLRTNGVERILFTVPEDAPEGCYVPIAVRAGGVTSNVASISISATGTTCSDATGLAASDIDAAQRSGQITAGTIMLNRLDVGPFGLDQGAKGAFWRIDFNSLLTTLSPLKDDGEGIRSSFVTPPLGTCTVSASAPTEDFLELPQDPIFPQFMNAGQALNLSGPRGTLQLPSPDYSSPDGTVIAPGDYVVNNGTGTQAVGPFRAALTLPPMLAWTNKDALASVDRTKDLTVTWSGGIPDKEFAIIVGIASSQQVTAGFLCAERVSAGRFTVPAWVLSSLPKSASFTDGGQTFPGGALAVGTAPLTNVGRFTATGLDFGVFTYEQATVSFLHYE